jgi:ribosomal protein S18 acetylase RimI-like enzyme
VASVVRTTIPALAIRRAVVSDHLWITALGVRAFANLGDYHEVLPSWLRQPNVVAWVDDPSPRRGFTMMAFYRDDLCGHHVADLLAITIDPPWRGLGLGRGMLQHAIAAARSSVDAGNLTELRLSVADDNHGAQKLYRGAGFSRQADEVGSYAGGQRAVRMVLPLR